MSNPLAGTRSTKFYKDKSSLKNMQKIETAKQKEKKKKRNQITISLIMVIIMILATAGYSLITSTSETQNVQTKEYEGIEFEKNNNFWITQIGDKTFGVTNHPSELEEIKIKTKIEPTQYKNRPLYIVNAPSMTRAYHSNLAQNDYIQRVAPACISQNNCSDMTLPTKNCTKENVIVYKDSKEETTIYEESGCILIEGDKMKGTDKMILNMIGIK